MIQTKNFWRLTVLAVAFSLLLGSAFAASWLPGLDVADGSVELADSAQLESDAAPTSMTFPEAMERRAKIQDARNQRTGSMATSASTSEWCDCSSPVRSLAEIQDARNLRTDSFEVSSKESTRMGGTPKTLKQALAAKREMQKRRNVRMKKQGKHGETGPGTMWTFDFLIAEIGIMNDKRRLRIKQRNRPVRRNHICRYGAD